MNRRDMLTEGMRGLAQVLPAMVASAGSLGVLLRRPMAAVVNHRPACFPVHGEEVVQPTATLLPKEDER
jgi:hypothetical protein